MKLFLILVLCSAVWAVTAEPSTRDMSSSVSSLPISHSDLHVLESAHRSREQREGRMNHPDVLTAGDLHPDTPIMLAEIDDEIPAFIVERQMVNQAADTDTDMETEAEEEQHETDEAEQATETEPETAADEETEMIESEFEVSGTGYGGGKKGGYGGGKKGQIVGYQKVPTNYKKIAVKAVPYPVKVPVKVPVKKQPPKKKLPPKKAPPKKKGGFGLGKKGGFGGGFGKKGFGYGGGFGGYGGGFGGHHH